MAFNSNSSLSTAILAAIDHYYGSALFIRNGVAYVIPAISNPASAIPAQSKLVMIPYKVLPSDDKDTFLLKPIAEKNANSPAIAIFAESFLNDEGFPTIIEDVSGWKVIDLTGSLVPGDINGIVPLVPGGDPGLPSAKVGIVFLAGETVINDGEFTVMDKNVKYAEICDLFGLDVSSKPKFIAQYNYHLATEIDSTVNTNAAFDMIIEHNSYSPLGAKSANVMFNGAGVDFNLTDYPPANKFARFSQIQDYQQIANLDNPPESFDQVRCQAKYFERYNRPFLYPGIVTVKYQVTVVLSLVKSVSVDDIT